jgi:uncharacterized delta-60 repeat protein
VELALGGSSSGGPENHCPAPSATPGALDPSFGDAGFAMVVDPSADEGRILMDMAVAKDGSIYGIGTNQAKMVLFRLDSEGALDTSFGDQGFVTKANISDWGNGLTFDPHGGLLVAGSNTNDAWIERYTPAGQLDASFGTEGRVTFDFGSPNDRAYKVLVKKDGSLVAIGSNESNGAGSATALAFMDENGKPNTNVGNAGVVTHKRDDGRYVPVDIVERDDGALTVLGWVQVPDTSQSHAYWLHVDARGVAEPGFGEAGFVAIASDGVYSFGITQDATGAATGWASSSIKLIAFDENAAVTAFARSGLSTKSVAFDCAGRVLAAGVASIDMRNAGALARHLWNGKLDPNFASSGVAAWASSEHTQFARVFALPDGRALVGGGSLKAFAFARYLQ